MSDAAAALERLPIGAAVVTDRHLVATNEAFARVLRTAPATLAGTAVEALLSPEDATRFAAALASAEPVAPTDAAPSPWMEVAGIAPDTGPWTAQIALGGPVGTGTQTGHIALLVPGAPALSIATDPHGADARSSDPVSGPASPWDRFELDRIISHDARGGLRGVKSFLTLLGRELGDTLTGQPAEYFTTAASAATRTDLMLERLVALLRLSNRPLVLTPVSLDTVVPEAMSHSDDTFTGPAPVVRAGSLPRVWGHRSFLVDALSELVTNARKFAEREVELRLSAETRGGWAYVTVVDDGPGIPAELAEDAFAPYRLLQAKGRFPGVGMGLPMVRENIRAQGGHCWIEPMESPGTTVRLRLALA